MYEWIELMTKERLVLTLNTRHDSAPLRPSLTSRSLSPPARSHNSPLSLRNSPGHNYSRSLQNSPLPLHDFPRPEARARPVSGSVYSILYRPRNSVTSPPRLRDDIKGEHKNMNEPQTKLRVREPRGMRRHSSYFVSKDTGTPIEGQIKSNSVETRGKSSFYVCVICLGSRPYSSALNEFDDAFAEYKQVTWAKKRREMKNNFDIEKYFENLATLLIQ